MLKQNNIDGGGITNSSQARDDITVDSAFLMFLFAFPCPSSCSALATL